MVDPSQKSTGTTYTTTVALLVVAFLIIPVVLLILRPFGHITLSLAIVGSVLCAGWAWFNWEKASRLTIPSIASPSDKAK